MAAYILPGFPVRSPRGGGTLQTPLRPPPRPVPRNKRCAPRKPQRKMTKEKRSSPTPRLAPGAVPFHRWYQPSHICCGEEVQLRRPITTNVTCYWILILARRKVKTRNSKLKTQKLKNSKTQKLKNSKTQKPKPPVVSDRLWALSQSAAVNAKQIKFFNVARR